MEELKIGNRKFAVVTTQTHICLQTCARRHNMATRRPAPCTLKSDRGRGEKPSSPPTPPTSLHHSQPRQQQRGRGRHTAGRGASRAGVAGCHAGGGVGRRVVGMTMTMIVTVVGLRRQSKGSKIGGKTGTKWDSRDGPNGHQPITLVDAIYTCSEE